MCDLGLDPGIKIIYIYIYNIYYIYCYKRHYWNNWQNLCQVYRFDNIIYINVNFLILLTLMKLYKRVSLVVKDKGA